MSHSLEAKTTTQTPEARALRILAKSVFRELKQSGYGMRDQIAFANEILDLVTQDARGDRPSDAE